MFRSLLQNDTRPAAAPALALGRRLLDALPSVCAVCHAWPARPICAACASRYAAPKARCPRCAQPVAPQVTLCGACLREPPAQDAALCAVGWDWPWTQQVSAFKFSGHIGLARPLAALMRSAPGVAQALAEADHVLPMPLAPARLAERGYNQALLLARALASDRLRPQVLLRVRDTPPQRGLPRAERLRNVRGAFMLEPRWAASAQGPRGARVVLVDDVMTSGASIGAAALVLHQAGAAHVTALVFARA